MSDSIRKTISINPSLFNMSRRGKTKTLKEKKVKPTPIISPNVLKRNLLKKIKEHQNNNNNKNNKVEETNNEERNFTGSFKDSMEYLSELVKKKKETKKRKKFSINTNVTNNTNFVPKAPILPLEENVNINLPTSLQMNSYNNNQTIKNNNQTIKNNNDMPYGCLKNGSKPTYRTWIRNTVKNVKPNIVIPNDIKENFNSVTPRENMLNNLRLKRNNENINNSTIINQQPISNSLFDKSVINNDIPINNDTQNNNNFPFEIDNSEFDADIIPSNPEFNVNSIPLQNEIPIIDNKLPINSKPLKFLKKKTIRRKYNLGRSKKNRTISVLIKGTNTRNKILKEKQNLLNRSINEIKLYLRKNSLIKAGSVIPNDVLRKMYESSILSGYVTNKNKDNLIHNFINNDV